MNEKYEKYPSMISTPLRIRKPPAKRNFQEDQLPIYLKEIDPIITDVFDLEKHAPEGFSSMKAIDYVVFYRLEFDEIGFPKLCESRQGIVRTVAVQWGPGAVTSMVYQRKKC